MTERPLTPQEREQLEYQIDMATMQLERATRQLLSGIVVVEDE